MHFNLTSGQECVHVHDGLTADSCHLSQGTPCKQLQAKLCCSLNHEQHTFTLVVRKIAIFLTSHIMA